jgi:hypothetical protein
VADIGIGTVETLVSVPTELVSYLFVSDAKLQHCCTLRWRNINFEQSGTKWKVCHCFVLIILCQRSYSTYSHNTTLYET